MIRILLLFLLSISLQANNVYFGYGSDTMSQYNKKDTMIALEVWIKEIMKDEEENVLFSFYDNSQKMAEDLKSGKLDIVITFGLEFVKYFEKTELVNGFTGGMNNRALENLILVVPSSSSAENLLGLKKPLIALQKDEAVSKLYSKYYFLKHTQEEKVKFLNVSKRQEALLKVFFHNADAAVVTEKTFNFAKELNPQIGKNLKIIEHTDIPAGSFGFFRKGVDMELRQRIIEKALIITKSNRGRQIMDVFQTDQVVETSLSDLVPIERLYNDYRSLKTK